MTVKNFKVGQGLDLDGLVLTNGNGELLVNGNAIAVDLTGYATEAYVANAVSNVTVDLSTAAGNYLDWNAVSEQFDVNSANVAAAIAGPGLTTDINGSLIPNISYGQGISVNTVDNGLKVDISPSNGLIINPADNGIQVDFSNVATTLVNSYNIAQANTAPTYDTVNALAGYGLTIGYNNNDGSYSIDVDTNTIATTSHVANAISNLVDSAPEALNTLNELAAALQDNPNVITSLQDIASGKQNILTEGLGIDIVGNTISTNTAEIANAIAGSGLEFSFVDNKLVVNTGSGIQLTNGEVALNVDGTGGLTVGVNGLMASAGDGISVGQGGITVDTSYIATSLAGTHLTYDQGTGTLGVNAADVASVIAGTGITYDQVSGTLQAAPGYISSVDDSFAVDVNGQLSLSDTITISSVELTDTVGNVTAASDVFGDSSITAYDGTVGGTVTIGTLPTDIEVADVFVTLKTAVGASIYSRTSKFTVVFTGTDAPTWTEYGIISSGWTGTTTISFDSSKNILVEFVDSPFSAKGVFTTLK